MDYRGTPEQNFAMNMKAFREAREWSQGELAKRMMDSGFRWYPATVYTVEQGDRKLPLDEALALCDIFELPLMSFVATPRAASRHVELLQDMRVLQELEVALFESLHRLRDARAAVKRDLAVFAAQGIEPSPDAGSMAIESQLAMAQSLLDNTNAELIRLELEAALGEDLDDLPFEIRVEPRRSLEPEERLAGERAGEGDHRAE